MHTFWKKKGKKEAQPPPPSMEGQTHLTLGKKEGKNEPSYRPPSMRSQTHVHLILERKRGRERRDTGKENKRKKINKRGRRRKKA